MTTVLNLVTPAYPLITNRIQVTVALQSDPGVAVSTQIDSTAGHPQKAWSFPGLARSNYVVTVDEIDGSGTVVNNIATFDVVPSQIDGSLSRDDEQITVGVTPGLVAGATSFVFDGTNGTPDYRGQTITFNEIGGRGILIKNVDYSWDSTTGTFNLLQAGDKFQANAVYNVHFNPFTTGAGSSASSLSSSQDFSTTLKTATGSILATDFGGALLLEFNVYGEMTLPDITTVQIGRPLYIETGDTGSDFCVKIKPLNTDIIKFKYGNIYMMPKESLRIRRFQRPDLSNEWRVDQLNGNFMNCGTLITADSLATELRNVVAMGSELNAQQYARLYNDVVLHLPINQQVAYTDWGTGNNNRFFSLSGSGGTFFVYNRKDLFEKSSSTGKAGDYIAGQVGEATFDIDLQTGDSFTGHPYNPTALGKGMAINAPFTLTQQVTINAGLKTYPEHCIYNKYILS